MDLRVNSIIHFGDETWLATEHGAYRIKGDSDAKRIPDSEFTVHSISHFGNETWLATSDGAYVIKADERPVRVTHQNLTVWSVARFGEETWLATFDEAYLIKGDTPPVRMSKEGLYVYSITHFDDEVWLATFEGAYRIKGKKVPVRVTPKDWIAHAITHFDNETWLATDHGCYRIKGDDAPEALFKNEVQVHSITHSDGETFLATSEGVYRIKGDKAPVRITETIKAPEDYVLDFLSVTHFGDETWLATNEGAYRIKGENLPQRTPDRGVIVNDIYHSGNTTWLATEKGAYRVDHDVIISPFVVSADSWWKQWLRPIIRGNFWISGPVTPSAQYERLSDRTDPYPRNFPRDFKFVMEKTRDKFDEGYKDGFIRAESAARSVESGKCELFLAVRDQWGNIFNCDPFPIRGWVIPGADIIPLLTGIFWLGILGFMLALAPFNTFCHDLLMNPFVRKYGSFGLVPLVMTVLPPVRRHVLRRYFGGICRDEDLTRLQQSYVVPTEDFLPEEFGGRLNDHTPVLLLGSSGIGKTSFFRYLTSCYAKRNRKLRPHNIVPVFVSLARYQGVEPAEMLHAQLERYGRLTDKKLTDWFLQQGGFLFLLDGLNEVDDHTRQVINRFVDRSRNSSYFCLSSQQSYQEYAWLETVKLASLNREKIQALLKQQLGEEQAATVIGQLTPETYEIYTIPQDLQIAITLIMQGKTLPRSRRELYSESLAPVFQDWIEAGQADFPDLLTSRAYEMLSTHDPFFDQPNSPLPADLTDKLLEKKVLIKRGDRLLFQHDLVRAYLSSRHFVQQWNAMSIGTDSHVTSKWDALLAKSELKIDPNWRSMLEFTILDLATTQATRDLLFALLGKNRQLAAELFKWVKQFHSNLVAGWEQEFNRTYGKISLE